MTASTVPHKNGT